MTELKETESNELVTIKEIDIPALFKKDGCDPIIEGLKKKAAEFEGDISTAKGRKAIASFAAKFSSAKTKMDGLGKALSDEYRAKIAPINEERNKIKACCDELRDEVRKPLTDWEDAEKERVAKHEEAIQLINDTLELPIEDSNHALRVIEYLKGIIVDEAFEEFELAATKAKAAALTQLEAKFIVLQHTEKEKAEAVRLEKERLAKEKKERETKIAKDATAKAKKDAKDAIDKAKREKREAIDKAKLDKRAAKDKADKEKDEAVKAEAKRISDEAETKRLAEEKLAKNKAHRGKLNKEAKQSFIDEGLTEERAEEVIKMIAKGRIANITINY